MTELLLSPAEIVKLTGKVRHASQAAELRHMGIDHKPRSNGTIAVSRAHVERVLGGEIGGSVRMQKTEPDFSGLRVHATPQTQR